MVLGTGRPEYTKQHSYQQKSTEYFRMLENKVTELAWVIAKRDKQIAMLQEHIRLYEGGQLLREKWEESERVNNESNTSDELGK